jgi:Tfp pilus assembly protein PilF
VSEALFWLAPATQDLDEKKHCLNAILEIDPNNTTALLALAVLHSENGDDKTV